MVEIVSRFEAKKQRWKSVVLENRRGSERRFHAVGGAGTDDAAEAAQRVTVRLDVVRQRIEVALDLVWGASAANDLPLTPRQPVLPGS